MRIYAVFGWVYPDGTTGGATKEIYDALDLSEMVVTEVPAGVTLTYQRVEYRTD